ncbi:glycosyltransferase [Embleya sp. NPDC050493]|uniref:glycosyltransferase n=1 Tax=Embleya sp. NPDC050493 TaxID=3363989 RepID=UPI0037BAE389
MSVKRDIFIVANNIEELGGVQRWVHVMADLFTKAGHRVHAIGLVHPQQSYPQALDGSYRTTTIHEVHPPNPTYGSLRRRAMPKAALDNARRRTAIRKGAQELSRIFRGARSGGVVICTQVWAMEWLLEADTHGMPVIGMSHESMAASKSTSRYGRIKLFYPGVDRFLLLTQEDADAWALTGMSQSGAMPNPLTADIPGISSLTARTVVAFGRLSHEKGFDLLIESWRDVARVHPDWTLRIYGEGPEEAALRAQIAAAALTGSVELMGQTADVGGALMEASMLVLPSRQEGWGLVLVEAMTAGVPCVAFDCAPSIREIITDEKDGLVIVPGNVLEFGKAINRLIEDSGLRESLGGAAEASAQRYSPDRIVAQWEREFDSLYR